MRPLLGSGSPVIGGENVLTTAYHFLDYTYRLLTGHFASGMTAHPITHDVQPEVRIHEIRIFVMGALATDICMARGYDTHPHLTYL
jgi:hypothetical protein